MAHDREMEEMEGVFGSFGIPRGWIIKVGFVSVPRVGYGRGKEREEG